MKRLVGIILTAVLLTGCAAERNGMLLEKPRTEPNSPQAGNTMAAETEEAFQPVVIDRHWKSDYSKVTGYHLTGTMRFTVENATLVTDMTQAGLPIEGFQGMRYYSSQLDETGTRPSCVNADGTLQENFYLAVLDVTCENVDYADETEEYGDPYWLRMDGISITLYNDALPETKADHSYEFDYYVCDAPKNPMHCMLAHVEPGESVSFKMGYLIHVEDMAGAKLRFTTNVVDEGSTELARKVEFYL